MTMTTEEFAKLEAAAALVREAHEALMSEMDRAGRRIGDAAANLAESQLAALKAGVSPAYGWGKTDPVVERQDYVDRLASMKFACRITHLIDLNPILGRRG
jgi:hypothetical protein